jgi:Mn2+/Fe2+ NRAMP family transporter
MSQATMVQRGKLDQDTAARYGLYAGIAVLVLGPILRIISNGIQVLSSITFWFGLYGWLVAGIAVGYIVYLVLRLLSPPSALPEVTTTGDAAAVPLGTKIAAGELPAWEVAELPAPPRFNLRSALAIIGPGAILLGTSIGSGEWLIGPAVTARFGGVLLWVATASIILQVVMNMEFVRYTMYTGEPIYTGFMRTKPGSTFWSWAYALLAFLQLGWPGWALSAATAIAAAFLGKLPTQADAGLVQIFGLICFLTTVAIAAFGSKIERTMELVQWFFIVAILAFLIVIGLAFTSLETWGKMVSGFVSFGSVPSANVDWVLLGGFAAYAGAGGVINGAISNWFRDKGFGMGGAVGFIPALIGGRKISLTHEGKVFPVTEENKRRWNEWWKFAGADQYGLWVVGCFLGMGLPALLTLQFIPPGTQFQGQAVAAYQAEYLSRAWGGAMWFITLLVGFWILYSTQIGITDGFVRMVTDIVWTGSKRAREWRGGDIRLVYYSVLAIFTVWGVFVLFSGIQPLVLILLGANMAGLNFVVLGLHTLYVNRKFLPRELRPALWREAVVLLAVLFFAFFFYNAVPGILKQLGLL